MKIKEKYEEETGDKTKEWFNGDLYYTYEYVMWLENKLNKENLYKKWIPVEDRLPELGQVVLLKWDNFSYIGSRDNWPGIEIWDIPSAHISWKHYQSEITHWMLIPEF